MPDKPLTIATYAAGASLAAITLVYVFGPTFFLDDDSRGPRRNGVVGLSNPANDCFINSVLQALAGLGDLRVYLIKEIHRRRQDELRIGPTGQEQIPATTDPEKLRAAESLRTGLVTRALKDMLDSLNERPIYKKTISAQDFVSSLERAFGTRLSRRQQDAQEMLQVVAERLCDEYHAGVKSRRQSKNQERRDQPDGNISTQHGENLASDLEKIATRASGTDGEDDGSASAVCDELLSDENVFPFEGKLESIVECETCRFRPKPSVSTFVTLTLNVPRQGSTTLDSCLDNLLKLEHIDDYKCDRCRLEHAVHVKRAELQRAESEERRGLLESDIAKLEQAIAEDPEAPPNGVLLPESKLAPKRRIAKFVRLSTYPKTLAIHLSRSIYDSYSTKNTAKVKFPEHLPLGGFDRKKYKLLALITHHGGHNSGHYETFRRQIVNVGFSPNAFNPARSSASIEPRASTNSERSTLASNSSGAASHSPRDSDPATPTLQPVHSDPSSRPPSETAVSLSHSKLKTKSNDRWWRISDDKIKECNTSDVLSMQRDAYLLFYELESPG